MYVRDKRWSTELKKRQMTILSLRKSETDFQYNKKQNYHNVYVQQDYIKLGTLQQATSGA